MFVYMSEPALKCENNNEAIFRQNYTLKLFIDFTRPLLDVAAKWEV